MMDMDKWLDERIEITGREVIANLREMEAKIADIIDQYERSREDARVYPSQGVLYEVSVIARCAEKMGRQHWTYREVLHEMEMDR